MKVLLGVTGSVAAIRTPELYQSLRLAGHHVKIVATQASLYFFDPGSINPADMNQAQRNREVVILDEDEWDALWVQSVTTIDERRVWEHDL